ncbi:MAG TPA: isoprenylcysteine carboxylmethyltransferase family protein [Candidatus Paceibacterota bacterium]|nr:isoprenylcysteine carboxylmethyltransferase family protein [Candidatus Paceibacterota bacterium]
MKSLIWKAVVQTVFGFAFFVAIIFLSAGTWNYWQGWAYIAVFFACGIGFTVYLFLYDVPLLERRMNAGPWKEEGWSQKIIVSLIILSFFVFMVLPVLDYRHGLSPVPAWTSILGDLIIVLSFLFIFWVLRVNSFAAANIAVESDQKVISSGPYAYVRHPMYAGAMWLFVGMPLALGSWWTIALIVPVFAVLMWRLLDEEKVLRRDLPGYIEYTQKVRFRLVPYVW